MKRLPTLLELIVLAFMAPVAPFVQLASAQTDWFVATNGTGGGTSWATATNSIQGAIDAAAPADTVWVSNGVYETGGATNWPTGTVLTNRVAIWKAITVRSKDNDPTNTIIRGDWDPTSTNGPAAVRCVYMTNGSTLIGFTLTNGATLTTSGDDRYGGGVWSQSTNTVISNCVLTGNSANWLGGGASLGTLFNCTLSGNSSTYGGGARASTLYNCSLISNSASLSGGGSYYGILNNCTSSYNSAYAASPNGGGGSYFGTLSNCTLIGNSAAVGIGGGARGGNLFNCTLISNSAPTGTGGGADGNGARDVTLSNCTLIGNSAAGGGGANNSILYNCTLTGNRVTPGVGGGGARGAIMYNCTLASNSASGGGGGTQFGTLYNCTLIGNSASSTGGGANQGTLYNCTLVGNSAGLGGGVYVDTIGSLYNCISWDNNIVDKQGTFNFSCGVGYTNGGSVSGNITNDPLFITNGTGFGSSHVAGNYHLRNESPPLNAGTNMLWMTNSWGRIDLDGLRRIDNFSRQVDMGCYELLPRGTMFIMK